MEIVVKKDIVDELQAKGVCQNSAEADKFLKMFLEEISQGIAAHKRVLVEGLGSLVELVSSPKEMPVLSIPSSELLAKFVQALSMERSKVQQGFSTIVSFIKEMVLKGHEVQLIDFAIFRIEDRKAYVLKIPKKGQSSVIPPRKVFVFEPDKKLIQKIGIAHIQFDPNEDIKKNIARLTTSSILFLINRQDPGIQIFEYYFMRAGWKVNRVQSVEEAQHFIPSGKIYLAILDAQVENYQSLAETIKFTKETSNVPLIILYPKNTDVKKVNNFHICGDQELIQQNNMQQLLATAEAMLTKIVQGRSQAMQQVMLRFFTTDSNIDKANELFGKLFTMAGLDEENQISFAAAFREALANAAQHGNKHRRDKLLEVSYLLDKEKMTAAVKDSGIGFHWQQYIDAGEKGDAVGKARQSHKEGRLGGLGIMLMMRCVDKIEYNESGNIVTLTKYLPKNFVPSENKSH